MINIIKYLAKLLTKNIYDIINTSKIYAASDYLITITGLIVYGIVFSKSDFKQLGIISLLIVAISIAEKVIFPGIARISMHKNLSEESEILVNGEILYIYLIFLVSSLVLTATIFFLDIITGFDEYIIIVYIGTIFLSLFHIYQFSARGAKNAKLYFYMAGVFCGIKFISIIVMYVINEIDEKSVIYSEVIGVSFVFLYLWMNNNFNIEPKFKNIKRNIKSCIEIFPSEMSSVLMSSSDRLIISNFFPLHVVGEYDLLKKVMIPLRLINSGLNKGWIGKIYDYKENINKYSSAAFSLILIYYFFGVIVFIGYQILSTFSGIQISIYEILINVLLISLSISVASVIGAEYFRDGRFKEYSSVNLIITLFSILTLTILLSSEIDLKNSFNIYTLVLMFLPLILMYRSTLNMKFKKSVLSIILLSNILCLTIL